MAPRDSADRRVPRRASEHGGAAAARAGPRRVEPPQKTFVFVSADGSAAGQRRRAPVRRALPRPRQGRRGAGGRRHRRGGGEAGRSWSRGRATPIAARCRSSALRTPRLRASRAGTGSPPGLVGRPVHPPGVAAHAARAGPAGGGRARRGHASPRTARFRAAAADTLDGISSDRLQTFRPRGVRHALAYDAHPILEASPRRYLVAGRKVVPGLGDHAARGGLR